MLFRSDIFVGGDVYTGPKFVIDAIEQGHQAADSLHRFVQPGTSMTIGKNRRQFIMLDKDNIEVDDYDHASRQYEGMDESIDYRNSFRDAHNTLSEEQVRIETSRCLSCGASVVDENSASAAEPARPSANSMRSTSSEIIRNIPR